MRENAASKGRRYLIEGRVIVTAVSGDVIAARVRGDGAIHTCGWEPMVGWRCSCHARTACSHLLAVRLVTVAGGAW